jgi:ADP-heptose:LPS heptosyltransferase
MGYDMALDCELRLARTAAFLRAAAVPLRIGFAGARSSLRSLFLTHPVQLAARRSYWESLVALAWHVDPDFPTTPPRLSLSPDATARSRVDQWLRQQEAAAPTRLVALHMGSAVHAIYRRWPVSRFIELAERIRTRVPDLLVILTGTPAERSLIDEFAGGFRGHCADATVLGSVHATALLLERCDLLVGNDTGVMHLGAAMGTPTVGLFGANSPVHWAPVGIRATYVCPTLVDCSPCLNSYRGVNPRACRNPEYQRCMLDIEPAHVIEASKRVVTDDWLG